MIHTVTSVYIERHGTIMPLLRPDGAPVNHYVSSPDLETLRELLRFHLLPETEFESVRLHSRTHTALWHVCHRG